jgi:hypothetical protein
LWAAVLAVVLLLHGGAPAAAKKRVAPKSKASVGRTSGRVGRVLPVAVAPKRGAGAQRRELHLRGLDRARRRAAIELSGFARPPGPNLFVFTDDRNRHFVATAIVCEEGQAGVRRCELELPSGYEQRPVRDLLVHVGSLAGRVLRVPGEELRAIYGGVAGSLDGAPLEGEAPPEPGDEEDEGSESGVVDE